MHGRVLFLTLVLSTIMHPVWAQEENAALLRLSSDPDPAEQTHLRASLNKHLLNLEGYVGISEEQLQALLGQPQRTEIQAEGIPEREALLWFYDFELTDAHVVHWRVALQNERVVGIQVATTQNPDPIYAGALDFLKEGGSTVGHAGNHLNRKVARRADLTWQVDLMDSVFGKAAVLEIGTVKYSTCDIVWDLEKLRGTDGFGNPLL